MHICVHVRTVDRERAYCHFLLAIAEDAPFCVLNGILVTLTMNDNLSDQCSEWVHSRGESPKIVMAILMSSVAALTYKARCVDIFLHMVPCMSIMLERL